jgi:hypothetical protein
MIKLVIVHLQMVFIFLAYEGSCLMLKSFPIVIVFNEDIYIMVVSYVISYSSVCHY